MPLPMRRYVSLCSHVGRIPVDTLLQRGAALIASAFGFAPDSKVGARSDSVIRTQHDCGVQVASGRSLEEVYSALLFVQYWICGLVDLRRWFTNFARTRAQGVPSYACIVLAASRFDAHNARRHLALRGRLSPAALHSCQMGIRNTTNRWCNLHRIAYAKP